LFFEEERRKVSFNKETRNEGHRIYRMIFS
jgi:hypothetical protein